MGILLLGGLIVMVVVVSVAASIIKQKIDGEAQQKALANFKDVFGFEPPSPEDGLDAIEKAQQKVDKKLEALAELYAEADLHEREVAKPVLAAISSNAVKRAQGPLKAKTLKIYLSLARQALEEAKAKFWRAHGLAKAFGFAVKPKYTDYLSGKMRRKVLGPPRIGGRAGPPSPIPEPKSFEEFVGS